MINNIFVSSRLGSVIPAVWTGPPFLTPSNAHLPFAFSVKRSSVVFRNSHTNRTAEIFIMSTFSLYRGDSNYQRVAPPTTIYEKNQWESSNSGNRHLVSCFDIISVANILIFPLRFCKTTLTWWSHYTSYTFSHKFIYKLAFFFGCFPSRFFLVLVINCFIYNEWEVMWYTCTWDERTCWIAFSVLPDS